MLRQYALWGGCALAAMCLVAYIARRTRRIAAPEKGDSVAGEAVRLLLRYRDTDKAKVLSSQVVDNLRREAQATLPPNAKLTLAACDLLDVVRRGFQGAEVRRGKAFDESCEDDVGLLKALWAAQFGPSVPFERTSPKWNDAFGFQGLDPQTDFRGGGLLALEQFVYFAQNHPTVLREMATYNQKVIASGGASWFLTAVVSIQFTVELLASAHTFRGPQLRVLYTLERGEDATAGLHRLHSMLLLFFFEMWKKDQPHVMEYTMYIPKVYAAFFNSKTLTAPKK